MIQSAWRIGVPLVALVVLATIIYFFGIRPFREINALKGALEAKDFLQLRSNALTGVAQALGGAILLTGLFFTWRSVRATEAGIRATQESTAKSLAIAQEGQITERFTRAIEQLGNRESLATRLGGIYALERIASDSEKDHWPVMEILTAFVRENAQWKDPVNQIVEPDPQQQSDAILPAVPVLPRTQEPQQRDSIPPLSKDIQAILTVLGRRTLSHEVGKDRYLDLREVDLAWADLSLAHLEGAIFYGAHLESAALRCAHLEGASFVGAHLERADLSDADLEGSSFGSAYLEGTTFDICRAKGVNFRSRLNNASFFNADLEGTDFRAANLEGAKFQGANLAKADFRAANLEHASLEFTKLTEANLKDAILTETNLYRADLTGAVGLTEEQVAVALNCGKTKFPKEVSMAILQRKGKSLGKDPPS